MPRPKFYDPAKIADLYTPDVPTATAAGNAAGVAPAAEDSDRSLLLLIDVQVDFVHPAGSLFVPGAPEDLQRTVEWMYDNVTQITDIAASLDSHTPVQIFSPPWWVDKAGNHPAPFTVVSAAEVTDGAWIPLYEPDWSREYVVKLEEDARKQLMIWPFHTLIGTPGHNLMPALYEAITYHSAARKTNPQMITKGTIPKSEYYSMLEPEIPVPGHPRGSIDKGFMETLASYDRIYVTGQAKSHCVLETTHSMMRYFADQPETIAKIHLIKDGTSSVQHPEIDFDAMADKQYADFAEKGMQIITVA